MNSIPGTNQHPKIQYLRTILEARRQETVASLRRAEAEQRDLDRERPTELGDFCNDTNVREGVFERISHYRRQSHMIDAALRRMEFGTFGECTACGDEIAFKRLEVLPLTEYCLRCQESFERDAVARMSRPGIHSIQGSLR